MIVYPNMTTASLGSLYTSVATHLSADSLLIASRDSADANVAIIVNPQTPHGLCARPTQGPAWISPTIAVRFEARPRGKKGAYYLVTVRGAAVSAVGNAKGAAILALCYLGSYAFPLESLPPPNHPP